MRDQAAIPTGTVEATTPSPPFTPHADSDRSNTAGISTDRDDREKKMKTPSKNIWMLRGEITAEIETHAGTTDALHEPLTRLDGSGGPQSGAWALGNGFGNTETASVHGDGYSEGENV
jgi:hypothetical protein